MIILILTLAVFVEAKPVTKTYSIKTNLLSMLSYPGEVESPHKENQHDEQYQTNGVNTLFSPTNQNEVPENMDLKQPTRIKRSQDGHFSTQTSGEFRFSNKMGTKTPYYVY